MSPYRLKQNKSQAIRTHVETTEIGIDADAAVTVFLRLKPKNDG